MTEEEPKQIPHELQGLWAAIPDDKPMVISKNALRALINLQFDLIESLTSGVQSATMFSSDKWEDRNAKYRDAMRASLDSIKELLQQIYLDNAGGGDAS
jgi:hypothetical protein